MTRAAGRMPRGSEKDAEGSERVCGLASSGAVASPPAAPLPHFYHSDTTFTARAKPGMAKCCFLPVCPPLAPPQEAQGST